MAARPLNTWSCYDRLSLHRTAMSRAAKTLGAFLLLAGLWIAAFSQTTSSPIHFAYRPIPFQLDSCETERRHAPETMAGGVAIFDYNNDGHLDIFFTNGADIRTLRKSSAKYFNRLFRNDGKGNFQDVSARAGLTGTGFDNGVAVGDYDNDCFEDLFVGGVGAMGRSKRSHFEPE
jgi:enediyne biosynthesis protein E4